MTGLYVIGAAWFNTTTLVISHDQLRVKTRLFPTPRAAKLALEVAELRQRLVHTCQHLNAPPTLGYSYSLNAILMDGRTVMIIDFYRAAFWQSSDKALELEERIEEAGKV